ncbi:MAG: SpoVT / AbrB like domain protein [Microgenomates bacterium OLB23]|nr:MAG: SpoVT / AbrB like domain protein [Microgenomates bacterium OLB23]
MLQKVIQVGNSLALTIPKSFVDKTGFKAGDEIYVHQEPQSKSLIITTKDQAKKMKLSPDLFSWLNDMEEKYSEAIKDLAKK